MPKTPESTYRVQLGPGFTFDDAAAIVPYLARLGVSHLYGSPVLQAAPGSPHGYDVVDHERLNDELGGEAAFARLTAALQEAGLGCVLDMVPNHMALAGRANRWWWDVLENGPLSVHARRFDIDWDAWVRGEQATVLAPVLGDHYGRVIEAGEVRLARDGGAFLVRYGEHELPLSPATCGELLDAACASAGDGGAGGGSAELEQLAADLRALPGPEPSDEGGLLERHRRKEALEAALAGLCESDAGAAAAIDAEAERWSRDPDRLDDLLRRQSYRLSFWRVASEELDYRRFFNIETLVGLRAEDETVFRDTHRVILELVEAGAVDGLRVDHVDGLRNPEGYLRRLKERSGGTWTVVEKILERRERLPESWPVEGTSGYDFLNRVDNLFVDPANEDALTAVYEAFTGESDSWADVAHASKKDVMAKDLRSEVEGLTRLLVRVCDRHRRQRDHTRRELRAALVELLAAFPVYRTYVQPGRPPSPADRAHVASALARVRGRNPEMDGELLAFLGDLLLMELPQMGEDETELALRFPQVSAPVMAKGVEDTAFYRYNRLVSLNEVGGDPGVFGRPVSDFHDDTALAAARWPHGMLTLSTHDTKRSADVRARIHLLSEMPGAWEEALGRLARAAEPHRRGDWPDRNAEYLLYQVLVGAWPISADRATAFMAKATREAKVHTSWVDPVEAYDAAVEAFVRGALGDPAFRRELERFLREHDLVALGRLNSLAATALLLTCPGVPDVYQGMEVWDSSLVDPDNRRAVDYEARLRLLDGLGPRPLAGGPGPDAPRVALSEDHDGATKLWLIQRLLGHRRRSPDLYRTGEYTPLGMEGGRADHAVAFARGDLVTVVPRRVAGLAAGGPSGAHERGPTSERIAAAWGDTSVDLPAGRWRSVLDGREHRGGRAAVRDLLEGFAVAVLERVR